MNPDNKLLANWSYYGLIEDGPDGEWMWTAVAKRDIPELTRMFLGDLLYGRSSAFAIKNIIANGFNQDGTVRKEAESERIH